ncbi:hypothetical protein CDAR_19061 [Caerostris darwini]|uniref:Uncharacterized protein n=1 Tax=Caerostris darwini TaxID=1538125 RepID=A0AAV4WDS3_9ARAC|nr:hypothetical protein CDAR_19061 [Caerostris darwini]
MYCEIEHILENDLRELFFHFDFKDFRSLNILPTYKMAFEYEGSRSIFRSLICLPLSWFCFFWTTVFIGFGIMFSLGKEWVIKFFTRSILRRNSMSELLSSANEPPEDSDEAASFNYYRPTPLISKSPPVPIQKKETYNDTMTLSSSPPAGFKIKRRQQPSRHQCEAPSPQTSFQNTPEDIFYMSLDEISKKPRPTAENKPVAKSRSQVEYGSVGNESAGKSGFATEYGSVGNEFAGKSGSATEYGSIGNYKSAVKPGPVVEYESVDDYESAIKSAIKSGRVPVSGSSYGSGYLEGDWSHEASFGSGSVYGETVSASFEYGFLIESVTEQPRPVT